MEDRLQIKWADASMIASLRHVWKVCFGDTEDYLDLFFGRRFPSSRALTAWVDDTLAGTVYLLDAEMEGHPFWYGYAVGTLPEFRGMGISRRLHEEIFRMAEEQNARYAVHPQGDHLIAFYEKLGLKQGFFHKVVTLCAKPADVEGLSLTELSAFDYTKLRDAAFDAPDFVRWDEAAVDYAVEENAFCGGFCRALTDGETVWALFGDIRGSNTLFLRETTMPDDVILRAVPLLAKEFDCTSITMRLPADSQLDGTVEMSGMVRGNGAPDCGYLNLMLD